jgi:DNA primase
VLSPQWLDQLRTRITLSGLVGRSVRLTRAGAEFKACCPFHNENTPSFYVNDQKGFYHCFGCGAHGDAIRWMTDHQGLEFMDAVKELAAEAGMDVPAPDPRAARQAEQRASLHDVMAAAQEWFVANLNGEGGKAARDYLATRGFDDATVRKFGFGFAPDERQALKAGLSRFPESMLLEAGLRIAVEGRDPYDRFRGRLMLPIQDIRGRVIAFGGRILSDDKTGAPKYLNSPETPLFDKGRTLYNLHRAATAARQSGRLIVVEGYMDVIALAAADIEEVVAPLGTALTEEQIALLWRQVDSPVLCFDGDAAGQRAAMRALERTLPLLRPGHSLKFAELPKGMDPDDIIRRSGREGFELQLDEAFTLLDFLWMQERVAAPVGTPEEKAGLKDRIDQYIARIEHPEIKKLYRRDLNDEFFRFVYPRVDSATAKKNLDADSDPSTAKWRQLARSKFDVYSNYMRSRLGAAIARGFIIWPDQLLAHAEEFAQSHDIDPRIDVMIDELGVIEDQTGSNFLVAIAARGLKAPHPSEFGYLRFPFAYPLFDRDTALASLAKAIKFYLVIPEVEAKLKLAQFDYEQCLDPETEEHQRFLLQRLEALKNQTQRFYSRYAPA